MAESQDGRIRIRAMQTVGSGSSAPLLSKERIIASPEFNRWIVPPAALAIHLSIGMAYGLSVFWLPLSRAIGITLIGFLRGANFNIYTHPERVTT